jgi:hypothetical protein
MLGAYTSGWKEGAVYLRPTQPVRASASGPRLKAFQLN